MEPRSVCFSLLLGAASVINPVAENKESWPDHRGPHGSGHVDDPSRSTHRGLPTHWSETMNIKWKTRIPLTGLSSPVIEDGRIWLTTATEEGHDYYVVCIDAESGKTLLKKRLFHWDEPQSLGNGRGHNCYATPSPVVEDGRVYVHYGSSGTACLDTKKFTTIWSRRDIPCWHYRGASSSPVLYKNTLILTLDGADLQYHIALDKETGATLWRTERSVEWTDEDTRKPMVRDGDWRKAHSTPILANLSGEDRLFSVGARAVYGYKPTTGQELWRAEFYNWSSAPRPVLHKDNLIFVTGFSRAELCAVKTGGTGNVTDTHFQWRIKNPIPKYASPIIVDDLMYIAAEESFLSCLDPANGETIWTERVGGKFRASPIYADGMLYFCSLDGTTTIIKPGRDFTVIASNKLEGGSPDNQSQRPVGFVASPAVYGKSLLLRSRDYLYCIEAE